MQLAELMTLRPVPCAGLLLTVTSRCPLRCAHCSTASTMASQEPDEAQLLRFVGSFDAEHHPSVLMLTGGEPLLRPRLVASLTGRARTAGARSALLTGAFFARDLPGDRRGDRPRDPAGQHAPIPPRILRAVKSVDHFSVSIDAFHEREVPRHAAIAVVRQALDAGVACSFHIVGSGPEDPYLADVTTDIRRAFGDRVPMLVNSLRPVGRAASWADALATAPDPRQVLPCSMAAWPAVAGDGTVLACCNQDVVDRRPSPAHLTLGHIRSDTWESVAGRVLASPVLRMIRSVGPTHLLARYGDNAPVQAGYCAGCRTISDRTEVLAAAGRLASGPAGALLDQYAARVQAEAGAVALVRRHGCGPYADLVALPGAPQ